MSYTLTSRHPRTSFSRGNAQGRPTQPKEGDIATKPLPFCDKANLEWGIITNMKNTHRE